MLLKFQSKLNLTVSAPQKKPLSPTIRNPPLTVPAAPTQKRKAMSKETQQQRKVGAQIVRLDKAFQLAEQWVNNMSKAAEDESTEVESEGRPPRLGLGAKEVPRQSKARLSNDPVERKLHAKLEAGKRKVAKTMEDSIPLEREDDSDGELESRTRVFAKKRPGPPSPSVQVKKKRK